MLNRAVQLCLGSDSFLYAFIYFLMSELEDTIVCQLFCSESHLGDILGMLEDGKGIKKLS